ncbi:23S rRNA (uracil(1939)-C(5))-methyltransferase RlmD [Vagococcus humatus]|uniref:23S rRNA (Uracil(1939)-C(5))-methyltransferase RlmD n=1 Tax=Vagococcus humatus TaxID=1889241 RepID=A0A3S0GEI2_9ENTE|nr:23S rRNA (uracil(1939)-C(5))-methyltransferase RlmD [Vagococcus humatus]RST89920.1 23S rRNA (uracil(1939)-C(5))-methyltransferase RlmD [Vagococcus humatus]
MKIQHTLKENQAITLPIKRLGINGEGIGYFRKTICFVKGALPGETVKATITRVAPKFVEAKTEKVLKKSPERITPPCEIYDTCGGCQLQHLSYQGQLAFKRDVVKQALHKFKPKGYQRYTLNPTIGMETPWGYRNKLQFQMRQTQAGTCYGGLYQPDSHQLVPIETCPVQHPATTHVYQQVLAICNQLKLEMYHERKNTGWLKTLMVRVGIKTGEVQVVFITRDATFPKKAEVLTLIEERLPTVASVMQNVQPKKSSQIMGEETIHLAGKTRIEEHLEEVIFDLSPKAFFQLNPLQTEVLYQEARKALAAKPTDIVVDAYCGVGTIGLSLASHVKEVWGMDTIDQAITDAKENAKRIGVTNAHYQVGQAETLLPQWLKQGLKPTAVVVDPPRTGLGEAFITSLLTYPVEKLVYVSCNPSTLARDLVKLTQVYNVHYLQSVDMFPQTARAEVVVKLTKLTK